MQRSPKLLSGLAVLLVLAVLAPTVVAQPAGPFDVAGWQQQDKAGCAAIDQPVFLPEVKQAEIFLFALPAGKLDAGSHLVELTVLDSGKALLRERLSLDMATVPEDFVVLEAFAEGPEERRRLSQWMKLPTDRFSVELRVDGRSVARMPLTEFEAQSLDARQLSILPTAVDSEVERLDRGVAKFVVCGDNVCAGGTFPNGEDCETCPQDCGSCSGICGNNYCGPNEDCDSCSADCGSCPICPTSLGEETRTELLSTVTLSWSCLQDIYYPFDSMYFQRNQLNYKRYRVERIRQCNGSITETVVPGSTTYFSNYCFRNTYISCFGGYAWPGCVY